MSASLLVSVVTTTYEPDLDRGFRVVGSIYPVTGKGTTLRNILLPCGSRPSPRAYLVDPGRYIVAATMPSGLQLTEDVSVDDDGAEVTLRVDGSPHASHTWQYVLGNVESNLTYHDDVVPTPRSIGSRVLSDRLWRDPYADVIWIPDATPRSLSVEWLNRLARRRHVDRYELGFLMSRHAPPQRLDPRGQGARDGTSQLFRIGRGGPVDAPMGRRVGRRQFLIAEMGSGLHLITLPLPWATAEAEVLLNLRQSATGSAVSVTVRDPNLGTGLGYLAGGEFTKAAAIFGDPHKMLYEKMVNPLGAAAGGYVMVGTDLSNEEARWDPWLGNLRERFPWLSDGAVLWGVRRLRTARNRDDLEQARLALIEAYDRGVPFFTVGLSWLVDALAEFPRDEECVRRRSELRRLCWRVDMREPFVILRMDEGERWFE